MDASPIEVLSQPEPAAKAPPKRKMPNFRARGAKKVTVEEKRAEFETLIAAVETEVALKAEAAAAAADASAASETAAAAAAAAAAVGSNKTVETSAFTICVRIRPVPADTDSFKAVIKGSSTSTAAAGSTYRGRADARVERAVVLTPTIDRKNEAVVKKKVSKFDHVWGPDATGAEVFQDVGAGLVENALAGRVCCCFAYGQTGSGKTHTMSGLMKSMATPLFDPAAIGSKYTITFSFFEILGVTSTDCLGDYVGPGGKDSIIMTKGSTNSTGVVIGEDLSGAIVLRNLTEHKVGSVAEFEQLVEYAAAHRRTRSTERNATSSRSHAVATIRVHHAGFPEGAAPEPGVLRVIDLAGSERAADSGKHDKQTMAETKDINSSLMALKECIRARTRASKFGAASDTSCFVPYRRNKLTLLMKDVFDIGCRRLCSTVVIANVSSLALDIPHTANTLGYAAPLRVAVLESEAADTWEVDTLDPANWDHDTLHAWIVAQCAELSMPAGVADAICPGALEGVQLIRMPEVTFLGVCVAAGATAADAKTLYGALWLLAVDAKTRKRRPDGSIITTAELEAEAAATEAAMKERADLWAARAAGMEAARDEEHATWKEGDPPTNPLEHMVQQRWKGNTDAADGGGGGGGGAAAPPTKTGIPQPAAAAAAAGGSAE